MRRRMSPANSSHAKPPGSTSLAWKAWGTAARLTEVISQMKGRLRSEWEGFEKLLTVGHVRVAQASNSNEPTDGALKR